MKTIITSVFTLMVLGIVSAQETPEKTEVPDTTRISLGKGNAMLIIKHLPEEEEDGDTIDAAPEKGSPHYEAHWAGIEFGPTVLLNAAGQHNFPNNPQWENDPGKSFTWNLNVLEHKFAIVHNYFGVTTGLGFNFTQIGLRQYVLNSTADSLTAFLDTVNNYSKNKLRAIYLTAPLMLEFCSQKEGDEGFYLSAGVIGGLRIASSVKRKLDMDKNDSREKVKGTYGLDAFRLDAALKMGYNNWGLFVNYNVLPLFDTDKTAAVYPLTFGLAYNF